MKLQTLTIKNNLTPHNFKEGQVSRIKYIVINYFGALTTAKGISDYFRTSHDNTSAHYCIDEQNTVYRSVEDKDIAWHCGTSAGYVHSDCRNANSIGIEVRPQILDAAYKSDAGYPGWYFTKAVEDNTVELTRGLMAEYSIPAERVLRHYDITGKLCPRPWVGADINQYYKTSGDAQWALFKKRLTEEKNMPMTQAEFNKMFNAALAERVDLPVHEWPGFPEAWRAAQAAGVIDGNAPQGFITREQVAVILNRMGLLNTEGGKGK